MTASVVLRFVCMAVFAVNTCLHLFWHRHGNLTKALILPTILLCYLAVAETYSPVIIVAAAASWLGDMLLMKNGIRWFTAGGVAFMLSHMLYGLSYLPRIQMNSALLLPMTAAVLLYCGAAGVTVWHIRDNTPEKTNGLLLIYLLTNAGMNLMALAAFISRFTVAGAVIYAGALLFFISDNALFMECFHRKKPKLFLTVMATYIAGEFMIVMGSALPG